MSDLVKLPVGTTIDLGVAPPVTRTMLALYAGGSNDHTTVHIDSDDARAAGFPDVFVHGMFNMAVLGRLLTDRLDDPTRLKRFECRFVARAHVGDVLSGTAIVEEQTESGLKLALSFRDAAGEEKLRGSALIAESSS